MVSNLDASSGQALDCRMITESQARHTCKSVEHHLHSPLPEPVPRGDQRISNVIRDSRRGQNYITCSRAFSITVHSAAEFKVVNSGMGFPLSPAPEVV